MIFSFAALVARAARLRPRRIAVAAAHDEAVLEALSVAQQLFSLEIRLIGDVPRMRELAPELTADPAVTLVAATSDQEAADLAVQACRERKADLLMKGGLETATLMRAVVQRETGLRSGRLLSHVMCYELEAYPKWLFLTDGGLNPFPNLAEKTAILENAARLLNALGYEQSFAAAVCASERVNPKVPSTVDAAALSQDPRFAALGMTVLGPVGLDLAVSKKAAAMKGLTEAGLGEADCLLVPTYEVGNGIGKALTWFAGARSAGVIVGAQVPIVLVSRADDAAAKVHSMALATVVAGQA